jgi:hypothetical protein
MSLWSAKMQSFKESKVHGLNFLSVDLLAVFLFI